MSPDLDGFWLPKSIRDQVITPESQFTGLSFSAGRECEPGTPGAVSARWPRLETREWARLLELLEANRAHVPRGEAYWARLQAALALVGKRLSDPDDPLYIQASSALPGYTGYSEAMIRFTLNALELISLSDLPYAFKIAPTWRAALEWVSVPELPGRLRFYPRTSLATWASRLPGGSRRPIYDPPEPPNFVTGYGAGNVPGTALLIALLAGAVTLDGGAPPITVIKNSRREPIFSPLVLSALEQADPDLFASLAILVWDYEDASVQSMLSQHSDLVIAAASDESIHQIQKQFTGDSNGPPVRFHPHGHKVSFSALGKKVLKRGLSDPPSGVSILDILALLAGLDSAFWDQHGCLSSRIHFIESGGDETYDALEYAGRLNAQLCLLASHLPRGNWPLQALHDRFDHYKTLETTGQVQVCSGYDDEFVVIVDQRQLDPMALYRQVNECQGRVIVVRPIDDLMEIPDRHLGVLPAANLQSISVALGAPGQPLGERELKFAHACGACGVTAIRSLGRAAFPQLAYSWDGLIPLDLTRVRPPGHFTTIEFDRPYDQILETFQLLVARAGIQA